MKNTSNVQLLLLRLEALNFLRIYPMIVGSALYEFKNTMILLEYVAILAKIPIIVDLPI